MLKLALKLAAAPAIMLAAMPAHSVELISSTSLTLTTTESPFVLHDVDYSDWYGRSPGAQRFLLLLDLGNPAVMARLRGRIGPVAPAAVMPEPMSWAMMIAGLAVVGGAFRSLHRRTGRVASFA